MWQLLGDIVNNGLAAVTGKRRKNGTDVEYRTMSGIEWGRRKLRNKGWQVLIHSRSCGQDASNFSRGSWFRSIPGIEAILHTCLSSSLLFSSLFAVHDLVTSFNNQKGSNLLNCRLLCACLRAIPSMESLNGRRKSNSIHNGSTQSNNCRVLIEEDNNVLKSIDLASNNLLYE